MTNKTRTKRVQYMDVRQVLDTPYFMRSVNEIVRTLSYVRKQSEAKQTPFGLLLESGIFRTERFADTFLAVLEKESDLPDSQQELIADIGKRAFREATITIYQKQTRCSRADAIQAFKEMMQ